MRYDESEAVSSKCKEGGISTMSKQELKQKGFTIIEVVLVLAIAALIFLMVFIALPALQRNQRDTARKQELQKVVAGVTTWQSNHRGQSPKAADVAEFAKYLDASVVSGKIQLATTDVAITDTAVSADATTGATKSTIMLSTRNGCNSDGSAFGAQANSRQAAAVVQMENGDAYFCQAS